MADHPFVSSNDLRIVGRNYWDNKWKLKGKSVALKVFNWLHSLKGSIWINFDCIYVAMTAFKF